LDFVSDCLDHGRRVRILVIVDDSSRECLAAIGDTSISGSRPVRELDVLIAWRGSPRLIVSDNRLLPIRFAKRARPWPRRGPEMTSRAVLGWVRRSGVAW
jgi:putative transposase